MTERSWFFVHEGEQRGPFSTDQFGGLVAKGDIRPDTWVWAEGMTAWQRAIDVPGLLSNGAAASSSYSGPSLAATPESGRLSFEGGTWPLFGRSLLAGIGNVLVIPSPWTATGYYRWFISHLRVPQRRNLAFAGQPGDIWYVFVLFGLCGCAGFSGIPYIGFILLPVEGYLCWMIVRWVVANISSDGQRLPLAFTGEPLIFTGWYVLGMLSIITIVGWAWVLAAWMRWCCLNVSGTRRDIVFKAGGWQLLGNSLLFAVGSLLIVTIPWALSWYTRWIVSRFELVESLG